MLSSVRRAKYLRRSQRFVVSVIVYAILICVSFLIIYPLFSDMAVMIQSQSDLKDKSVVFIAKHFTMEHIQRAWETMRYGTAAVNSLGVCLLVSVLQTFFCTMIGYGFARCDFPFKRLLFAAVIFTILVPSEIIMPSLYARFQFFDVFGIIQLLTGESIKLLDTVWPFVMTSVMGIGLKNGLYIYLARQFFRGLPKELEESGRIDGAGSLRIYWSIMLPNASAILVTIALFSFSWQWADQYLSFVFLPNQWILPRAILSLTQMSVVDFDPVVINATVQAGVFLMILPMLILYLTMQRFFVQGITRSGIVG